MDVRNGVMICENGGVKATKSPKERQSEPCGENWSKTFRRTNSFESERMSEFCLGNCRFLQHESTRSCSGGFVCGTNDARYVMLDIWWKVMVKKQMSADSFESVGLAVDFLFVHITSSIFYTCSHKFYVRCVVQNKLVFWEARALKIFWTRA
jgi:hypothetical protein